LGKYEIDTSEGLYEPGANELVLKNKLGILDPTEMDDVESELLLKLYEKLFLDTTLPEQLKFNDILGWHRQWLGNVYDWAGKVRSSNIGKGGFQFASVSQLEKLIEQFEAKYLKEPRSFSNKAEFIHYLAESHIEFILIHPFREGNGRISRLLMDTISVKAGYGLLDYSLWDTHKEFYFRSIQAGVDGDYQHLAKLVKGILPC
jgi:cell filamentation protein